MELKGCPSNLLNDAMHIREAIVQAVDKSLSTLLKFTSHKFEPQGVTAIALLAESHLSIHTWPELGYAAVDIFTCGNSVQPEKAAELLIEKLGASNHSVIEMQRGTLDTQLGSGK